MARRQKMQKVSFHNEYVKAFNEVNSLIANGTLTQINIATMVNYANLVFNMPNSAAAKKPFNKLTDAEKDTFFKRKNEKFLIDKVLDRVFREFQQGNPISETFICDIKDQEAQLSAMYKLVAFLMYAILPYFQAENGNVYYYLFGFTRELIDDYYADVKDDQHIEERYRDPTLEQLMDDSVGKTAAQAAQLGQYSKYNGITHNFLIYNHLVKMEEYIRNVVLKYHPKNSTRTLSSR